MGVQRKERSTETPTSGEAEPCPEEKKARAGAGGDVAFHVEGTAPTPAPRARTVHPRRMSPLRNGSRPRRGHPEKLWGTLNNQAEDNINS